MRRRLLVSTMQLEVIVPSSSSSVKGFVAVDGAFVGTAITIARDPCHPALHSRSGSHSRHLQRAPDLRHIIRIIVDSKHGVLRSVAIELLVNGLTTDSIHE
jgi:hypothetical protein